MMKIQLYLLSLGLLLLAKTANAQGGGIFCPSSTTLNFSALAATDQSAGGINATTCQKIVLLSVANTNAGTSFTTAFSAGTPAPTLLPDPLFSNSNNQPVGLGRGQTVVTVTVDNGSGGLSCAYTITLIDDVPPDLSYSPNVATVNTTTTMPDLRGLLRVYEDCDYTVAQLPAPGSPVSGPSVSVTFVATDASGNVSPEHLLTLNMTATTPYDALTVTAVGGCVGSPIDVTLSGLPADSWFLVTYQLDNGSKVDEGVGTDGNGVSTPFQTAAASPDGQHVVTILSIQEAHDPPVLLNRSVSVFVGTPAVGVVSVAGTLCGPGLFLGGTPVTMSANATPGARYQWYKDGPSGVPVAINGQTSAVLTIPAVQPSDAGSYSLEVSTNCSSVTSAGTSLSVATLEVTVVITLPNGSTVTVSGQTPTITLPKGKQVDVQITGGVFYDWTTILNQLNSYEIRQRNQNTTGQFTLGEPGPYKLTVISSGGCSRTVEGNIVVR